MFPFAPSRSLHRLAHNHPGSNSVNHCLGIDLGNTKIAVGVVTADGNVLSRVREETADARQGDGIVAGLIRLGRAALAGASLSPDDLRGVGIALPGPADRERLAMRAAPHIPEIEGVPLGDRLAEAFGVPVAGDNDANAAALGEARFGAGRGAAVVAYFTISTGIGGGIVAGGRLFRGATGAAGEFGHQVLERDGDPCHCGGAGCLETIASGPAIAQRARRMLPPFRGSLLADPAWRADRPWDAGLVAAAAREEDPLAVHLFDEVGEFLGLAVANVIDLFDPDCVVLGGGVMAAADLLLPAVQQAAAERAMPRLGREVRILPAALGPDVGVAGAAALAMEAATSDGREGGW
jgi:glucokinase